jgi:polysaccharide biosynthesis/export protein
MKRIAVLFGLFFMMFLLSCTSRYYKYIQDKDEFFGDARTEFSNQPPDYKIRPHDILYVKIITNDEEINKQFNAVSSQNSNSSDMMSQNSTLFLSNFNVTDSGYVTMPVLGRFNVMNKTIGEVQQMVQERTNEKLIRAYTIVKLISFKITFLGEIIGQGTKTFYQEKLNILEAIANAGGINDYGDKSKILILRPTETGTKTFRIDISKRDLLESPGFYLLPNDMVIVEPIRFKTVQMNITNMLLYLSTLSAIITAVALIKK